MEEEIGMKLGKRFIMGFVLAGVLLCFPNADAIMRGDAKLKSENQSESPKRGSENKNRIKRATECVQKIENGVLYTDKTQYDLKGVKVIEQGDGNKISETSGGRKRVAEMIFVNDTLREVIIHK